MSQSRTTAEGDASRELAEDLSGVVARLAAGDGAITVEKVVALAARAVPHAHHSAITVLRPKRPPVTAAASDDVPRRVDALQYELREGPCLDAAVGSSVALSKDVATDPRWPTFGPRCAKTTGIRSMLGLRLPVQGEEHAAVNYYSADTAAFEEMDVVVASVIVPIAALVIEAGIRRLDHDNFTKALASSRHISTAVGIVMSTRRVSNDEAFQLIRRASMALNVKLSLVADEVNLSGMLPSDDDSAGNSAGNSASA